MMSVQVPIELAKPDPGSYRDPSGHVHVVAGRVFRTIKRPAAAEYEFVRQSGLLDALHARNAIPATREVERSEFAGLSDDVAYVLEHERLPWISYPYEWTFSGLKKAALLHLDVHIEALNRGVTLSDASAYNVQFVGTRPVFIDLLSFRRYRDGEFWGGHRQFCEQFLNPLLLTALLGVRHNGWYRGTLEGIDTLELNRMLNWRHKLSWNVLSNVSLQARFQQNSLASTTESLARLKQRKLARTGYLAMLMSMRDWIAGLIVKHTGATVWQNYSRDNTYSNDEASAKHKVIQAFAERVKPALAWDIGCNTGEYSETLLKHGANYVVSIDFDHGALENAFARSDARQLSLQPVFQDAANPSPGQGWRSGERAGLMGRCSADGLVALAFEHHLAIGRNIPLPGVVEWLTSLAPQGIIEFVQKSDETVQKMLAIREDIFTAYDEDAFSTALGRVAHIVDRIPISGSGRVLYWYERLN